MSDFDATVSEVTEVLIDEYLGIGAIPKFAIASAWLDLAEGRLTDTITEMRITEDEMVMALLKMTMRTVAQGNLNEMRGVTV